MGDNKRISELIGLTYGNRKHFGFPELVALGGSKLTSMWSLILIMSLKRSYDN